MRRPDYEASADSDAFRVNPIDKRQTSRPAIILFDDRNAGGRPIPDPPKKADATGQIVPYLNRTYRVLPTLTGAPLSGFGQI